MSAVETWKNINRHCLGRETRRGHKWRIVRTEEICSQPVWRDACDCFRAQVVHTKSARFASFLHTAQPGAHASQRRYGFAW